MCTAFLFWFMVMFWNCMTVMHNLVNKLRTTELYTLKWQISFYVKCYCGLHVNEKQNKTKNKIRLAMIVFIIIHINKYEIFCTWNRDFIFCIEILWHKSL